MASAGDRLTIPAAYLEEMRAAVMWEIADCSNTMLDFHKRVTREGSSCVAVDDRDNTIRWMQDEMHVLDQILDSTDDIEITANADTLAQLLEEFVRVLTERLNNEKEVHPLDLDAAGDMARKLTWAAEQGKAAHAAYLTAVR